MKKAGLALVLILLATTASAQLIVPKGSTVQLLIPAAGSVQGVGGTFFRSDITLINYRTTAQLVRFRWLPENAPGTDVAPIDVTIAASSGIVSEDFVTSILGKSGLGAILVTAINTDGTLDTNGRLFATARIWTPQPGSSGTVSQTFPTIATSDIPNTQSVAIIGQRRDERYRLNAGIINLDATRSQTFTVTVSTGATQNLQNVVVPPFSLRQIGLTGVLAPTIQITVQNVTSGAQSGFVAYGSSVDNTTGDGWSSLGFTPP